MKKFILFFISISIVKIIYSQDLINEPKDLDKLWNEYFSTKKVEPIKKIIMVLDWKDNIKEEIINYLNGNISSEDFQHIKDLLISLNFKITEIKTIDTKYDMDIMFFLLLPDKNYNQNILEISNIIKSKKETLEKMKIKAAALWSLKSNAKQDEKVKGICEKEKSNLTEKSQFMMNNFVLVN